MSTIPNITIMLVRLDELCESYPDDDEYLRCELSKAYPKLAAEIRRLSSYADQLRDAVEWMSGSPSFGPGEEAGDAFRRNVLPLLHTQHAPRHDHRGNCIAHECPECSPETCDVCHEHEEPRGECSACPPCQSCWGTP